MTKEKVEQVIATYRRKFEEMGVGKVSYTHDDFLDSPEHGLEHCHAMLDKMEVFIEENRIDKVFRWLGFIQGVLWSQGIYTLTELTGHNLPDHK